MTEKRIARDGESIAADIAMTDAAKDGTRFVATIDATPLTGVQRHRDGYIAGRVRAARTGVQVYAGSEVGRPDLDTVRVYRPLDEVMRLDSLGSYKGKPVTDGHPGERVTADNWDRLARGTVMGVHRDGEAVSLDVTVSAQSLVDKLERGEARELSAGYVARLDWTPGTTAAGEPYDVAQRDIYVDHLAVVPRGRAGSEFRVGDADKWGAAPITPSNKEDDMSDALKTVVLGDKAAQVAVADAQIIEAFVADQKKALNDAVAAKDAEIEDLKKQVETKDGELVAAKKSLEDATSPAALADMAKKRTKALEAGKKAGMSEEDMDKMDDAAIRKAVVAKSLGDTAKEMSDAAIDGAFAALSTAPTTRTDDSLAGGIRTQDADPWAFLDEKKGA